MVFLDDILSLIGNTPLVRLTKLFPEHNIFAKLESNNLTGSMKARSALGMIIAAEKRGELQPGMEIIESTSGNLGYALAAIGALKGYDVTLVIDPKTDELKRNMLKAYGARLVIIDKPDEHGAYQPARMKKVEELLKKRPNSWSTKQYSNLIVIRSFSKSFGLPGLRIGYSLTSNKYSQEIETFRLAIELPQICIDDALKYLSLYKKTIKKQYIFLFHHFECVILLSHLLKTLPIDSPKSLDEL